MDGQKELIKKTDQKDEKLTGFELLQKRYTDLSQAIKVTRCLVVNDYIQQVKPKDSHEQQINKAEKYIKEDQTTLTVESYKMTDDQIKLGSLIYLEFMDYVAKNPCETQGEFGINDDIRMTLTFLDSFYIEYMARLSRKELKEKIQQNQELTLNPATMRINSLKVGKDIKPVLITKQTADIDYKTALDNARKNDIIMNTISETHPMQIHYLKGLEPLFDPIFRQDDFGF